MARSFTLSARAADILSEDLRLNLRQFPFEIDHHGATLHERAGIRSEVWDDLQRRQLADRDEIEPELYQALTLLHGSDISVAVTAMETDSDEVFRARVAVTGRTGVQVIQNEQGLRLQAVDPRGLARVCSELLPDLAAGRLESATITTGGSPQPGGGDGSWLDDGQVTASQQAGGPQLRRVRQIMGLPTTRIGYFFVTGRDERGKPVQLPAVGWRDTEQGRYSVTTRRNNDGEDWHTFAGADKQRIATYLGEQLGAFQHG